MHSTNRSQHLHVSGWPYHVFDANLCPFAGWDTWHHYIITSCRGHLLLTWGLLTLVPYESQLSSLNIRESILGTCHGACLLKSPTAQTSISGSDASLRHAPRASPQASSSPRTHISFHHRSFFSNVNLREKTEKAAVMREVKSMKLNRRSINFSEKLLQI